MGLSAVLIAVGGGVAGWLLARRGSAADMGVRAHSGSVRRGVEPYLLPDPALDWLRRAHGALGVWVAELDPREEGPRAERIVDAERLAVAQIVAVDRRLERARDQEQSGAERMDGGTFVFHAAAGAAVGVLLPDGFDTVRLSQVEDDLQRLLDGVRRKPQVVAIAQAQTQEASLESAASVGLRLAYQIERMVEAEVVIAAADTDAVRVIGVSGRADRRLLDSVLPAESELARVARGESEATLVSGDPLGGAVTDRRQRAGTALLFPMRVGIQPVGAAALWLSSGGVLAGAARAEVLEALANAASRVARALEADRHKQAATLDPLTGLHNRRGFEEFLARYHVRQGALIYADLDRFKALNDTLGHPAGDAALVHFARILREQVRAGDLAARIGGEEFAIWLPGADLELGVRIAERVRIKIGTTPWDWRGQVWPLTASFGVAACPETSRSLDNLPSQADAALYSAKRGGRDRVEKAG